VAPTPRRLEELSHPMMLPVPPLTEPTANRRGSTRSLCSSRPTREDTSRRRFSTRSISSPTGGVVEFVAAEHAEPRAEGFTRAATRRASVAPARFKRSSSPTAEIRDTRAQREERMHYFSSLKQATRKVESVLMTLQQEKAGGGGPGQEALELELLQAGGIGMMGSAAADEAPSRRQSEFRRVSTAGGIDLGGFGESAQKRVGRRSNVFMDLSKDLGAVAEGQAAGAAEEPPAPPGRLHRSSTGVMLDPKTELAISRSRVQKLLASIRVEAEGETIDDVSRWLDTAGASLYQQNARFPDLEATMIEDMSMARDGEKNVEKSCRTNTHKTRKALGGFGRTLGGLLEIHKRNVAEAAERKKKTKGRTRVEHVTSFDQIASTVHGIREAMLAKELSERERAEKAARGKRTPHGVCVG
jgi:hypothetical protein